MCDCAENPKCCFRYCGEAAALSIITGCNSRSKRRAIFICQRHYEGYLEPIPGLDRPKHASEFWKPSLFEMMRLAGIKQRHEDQMRRAAIDHSLSQPGDQFYFQRLTPAQIEQVMHLRRQYRKFRSNQT